MDLAELINGYSERFTNEEAETRTASRLACFEYAWRRSSLKDAPFAQFIDSLPDMLFYAGFSTRGVDEHYVAMLAALFVGEAEADFLLASALNYAVTQLTYQGRYFGIGPEAFVFMGRDDLLATVAVANAERHPSFRPDRPIDLTLHEKAHAVAIPADYVVAPVEEYAGRIKSIGRTIGCVAFTGLGGPDARERKISTTVELLRPVLSKHSIFFFAGSIEQIEALRSDLLPRAEPRYQACRYYSIKSGNAFDHRGILVLSEMEDHAPLIAYQPKATKSWRMVNPLPVDWRDEIRGRDATSVSSNAEAGPGISIHRMNRCETVKMRRPRLVRSSAPLPKSHIATMSDAMEVDHVAAHIRDATITHSSDIRHQTYVIGTLDGRVIEQFQEEGQFQLSSYYSPPEQVPRVRDVPIAPMSHVEGTALLLVFSPNVHTFHSHFLLQCYPRLQHAAALGLHVKIAVPDTLRAYQVEMLSSMGFPQDRLVFMERGRTYAFDELVVPRIIPAIFTPYYMTVYDKLANALGVKSSTPTRRIMISRAARTAWRNLVNYDSIVDMLVNEHQFELVSPEKLSIKDEIQLFRDTAIVVGAEGAGLYNGCFMSPGSNVLCLADQDYLMPILGSMAEIRSLNISYIFGESFIARPDLNRRWGHSDFVVSPALVSNAVAEILHSG